MKIWKKIAFGVFGLGLGTLAIVPLASCSNENTLNIKAPTKTKYKINNSKFQENIKKVWNSANHNKKVLDIYCSNFGLNKVQFSFQSNMEKHYQTYRDLVYELNQRVNDKNYMDYDKYNEVYTIRTTLDCDLWEFDTSQRPNGPDILGNERTLEIPFELVE